MKHKFIPQLLAAFLTLALVLTPAAHALTLNQARELLDEFYIDEVPEGVLTQPTIQDMIDALGDPYTQYFTREEYQEFTSSMEDSSLVGIGISSSFKDEGLTIAHVYDGGPAQEGGLLAGDIILTVDGNPTAGADLDTITSWIRGDEGSTLVLTYLRGGTEHTVTLTRREVVIPATITDLLDDHIGYITCDTFGGETLEHFTNGINTYSSQADRWIVDLRTNLGGSVNAAVQSAGLFTGPGTLGYLRDGEGDYESYGSSQRIRASGPVIVLSSAYTASAAELFSAAVRDTGAGLVVGGRTYGKGVAQSVFDRSILPWYFPNGDAMKITSARFFAPSGCTTDKVGVIPHLLVPSTSAYDVALLLCASAPAEDTAGFLRLELGGQWYIRLDSALEEDCRDAFLLLLEAIPSSVRLLEGTGSGWQDTTPAAVAQQYGLEDSFPGFSDIGGSPYSQQIEILGTYGIVSGGGGGTFDPTGSLTRAQLCALLYQALDGDILYTESAFTDVDLNAWYGQPVNCMAGMGLVTGVGGGEFCPDDPVTHEQLITILGRMAKRLDMYLYEDALDMPDSAPAAPELAAYADWAKADAWLLSLSQSGSNLLWDAPEAIDPAAAATREEAASLVYSLFFYVGLLPA